MPRPARQRDTTKCPAAYQPPSYTIEGGWCSDDETITPAPRPHVGGPVVGGSPNVMVEGLPAARCGDMALCAGAPQTDLLVTGAAKIKINGRLAAMVGSKIWHDGEVTTSSATKTMYGAASAGAVFGSDADAAAATAACKEAAQTRQRGQSEAKNGRVDERQSKDMNCGPETARQICLQRCAKEGKGSKACAACKPDGTPMDEENWYRRYLQDEQIKESYKADKNAETEQVEAYNDRLWKKLGSDSPCYKRKGADSADEKWAPSDFAEGGWRSEQGESFKSGGSGWYEVKRLPEPIEGDVADISERGRVGSYSSSRAKMLAWCGIESTEGPNTGAGVGSELAEGNQVVAIVDANKLPGNSGGVAPHVVTVSQMRFDANGKLEQVTVNDTQHREGCGRKLTGDEFETALLDEPGRTSNIVKPSKKP